MKGIDIFCTSQAATAISLSMEEPSSSSSSSSILLGSGRAIDRHNPIIRDSRRISKSLPPCNNPQSPINPKPHKNHNKKKNHKIPLQENYTEIRKSDGNDKITAADEKKKKEGEIINKNDGGGGVSKKVDIVRKSWSCTRPGSFISPPGSTRYLLGDDNKVLFNAVADSDAELKVFPEENSKSNKIEHVKNEESFDGKPPLASISQDQPQVVVLRVSLHCRGCEKKMRKHISRMEGVTSFNIDFMAKKVTVTGNVTPLSVLSSISKVKNAQLWPPTVSSTSPSVNHSGLIKNEPKGQVEEREGVFVSMASQI